MGILIGVGIIIFALLCVVGWVIFIDGAKHAMRNPIEGDE